MHTHNIYNCRMNEHQNTHATTMTMRSIFYNVRASARCGCCYCYCTASREMLTLFFCVIRRSSVFITQILVKRGNFGLNSLLVFLPFYKQKKINDQCDVNQNQILTCTHIEHTEHTEFFSCCFLGTEKEK